MISSLHIYQASGSDPFENLAREQVLLEQGPADGVILYLWQNQNTVVIGRNQNAWGECRTTELNRDGGHLARRLSGGGAVYHDMGNLNFTFLVSKKNYDLPRQLQVIVTACRNLGLNAQITGRNDVAIDGRKFSGNSIPEWLESQFVGSGSESELPGRLASGPGKQIRPRLYPACAPGFCGPCAVGSVRDPGIGRIH